MTTPADLKDLVRRFLAAANNHDDAALEALLAPDLVRHCAATPDVTVRSARDFIAFDRANRETFPDQRVEVNRMVAEGDTVALHATYSGTQRGQMGPFPPTGKQTACPFLGMLRIENGRIAEMWVEWDNLVMLTQLGHFPPVG